MTNSLTPDQLTQKLAEGSEYVELASQIIEQFKPLTPEQRIAEYSALIVMFQTMLNYEANGRIKNIKEDSKDV